MAQAGDTIITTQGEALSVAFLVTDEAGTAQDITGWTARLMVRTEPDSDTVVQAITGTTIVEGTNGLGSIEGTITAAPGVYVYDLEFTDTAGDLVFSDQARFIVRKPVTRD